MGKRSTGTMAPAHYLIKIFLSYPNFIFCEAHLVNDPETLSINSWSAEKILKHTTWLECIDDSICVHVQQPKSKYDQYQSSIIHFGQMGKVLCSYIKGQHKTPQGDR